MKSLSKEVVFSLAKKIPNSRATIIIQLGEGGDVINASPALPSENQLWDELRIGDYLKVNHISRWRTEDGGLVGTLCQYDQVVVIIELYEEPFGSAKIMTVKGSIGYVSLYSTQKVKLIER